MPPRRRKKLSRHLEHPPLAGPAGALECQLLVPDTARPGGALVCHPHPQHGGTMHTKAVYRVARAFEAAGLAVLRFNFRGVGRSAGRFAGGPGERDDARAALALLRERSPGGPLVVGGFSFGSWIGTAIGREDPRVAALVAVAPPVAIYDFEFLHGETRPILLIAGDRDPFCPAPALDSLASRLGPRTERVVLRGAEHLLATHLDALQAAVHEFTTRILARL